MLENEWEPGLFWASYHIGESDVMWSIGVSAETQRRQAKVCVPKRRSDARLDDQ